MENLHGMILCIECGTKFADIDGLELCDRCNHYEPPDVDDATITADDNGGQDE